MCVMTTYVLCTGAQRSHPPARPKALGTRPRPGCLSPGRRGPNAGPASAEPTAAFSGPGGGEKAWESVCQFQGGERRAVAGRPGPEPAAPPRAPCPTMCHGCSCRQQLAPPVPSTETRPCHQLSRAQGGKECGHGPWGRSAPVLRGPPGANRSSVVSVLYAGHWGCGQEPRPPPPPALAGGMG